MKITTKYLNFASAVVLATTTALLAFSNLTETAPTTLAGMKTTDFRYIQQCLLNATVGATNPDSLCHRLLHPTAANSHPQRLTPSEQSRRVIFYTEAASLWSVFSRWSQCALRTMAPDNPRQRCRLSHADYGGFYLKDFRTDRYNLRTSFADTWNTSFPHRNAEVARAAHCFLHHGQDGRTLPYQLASCAPYDHLTVENVGQRWPGLGSHLLHFWKATTLDRHRLLHPNQTAQYWGQEEAIFHCLYAMQSKSARQGVTSSACGQILGSSGAIIRALSPSFEAVPARLSVGGGKPKTFITRHLVEFLRADRVYDCLRHHRHQRAGAVPWCRGVFEQLGGCPGATVEHPHTYLLKAVLKVVEQEEEEEVAWWERNAAFPFQVLPYRLRKLCVAHRACGDPLVFRRPPADCKVGGLYHPFLDPVELSAQEKEQLVPEKDW